MSDLNKEALCGIINLFEEKRLSAKNLASNYAIKAITSSDKKQIKHNKRRALAYLNESNIWDEAKKLLADRFRIVKRF